MSNLNGGLSGSGLLRGALGGGGVAPPQDVYWDDILDKPDFATVATSGSYNDLTDKPTIPAAQVNADWNATSGVAEILNKPTIPAAQVNADWNATSGVAEILNKPTIPAAQVNADWNATSGVAEILNKPTIPAAQVNADWNATSGVAAIFNKPTIPTTAAQISYDNTTSGLTATDTQEAIDENAAEITTIKSNLIQNTINVFTNSASKITKENGRCSLIFGYADTVPNLLGATLPEGYRPIEAISNIVLVYSNSTNKIYLGYVTLSTAGTFTFYYSGSYGQARESISGADWRIIGELVYYTN